MSHCKNNNKIILAPLCVAIFLSACGGGSDSGGDKSVATPSSPPTTRTPSAPIPENLTATQPSPVAKSVAATKPIVSTTPIPKTTPTPKTTPPPKTTPMPTAQTAPMAKSQPTPEPMTHEQLALTMINELSIRRNECGFGGLEMNEDLNKISQRHAAYLQHVFSTVNPTAFWPHSEKTVPGIEQVTGENNPYYTADRFSARVEASDYLYRYNQAAENIATRRLFTSRGVQTLDPNLISKQMLASLLAAPYHLATLVSPDFDQIGASFVSYLPAYREAKTSRSFTLVTSSGSRKPPGYQTQPSGLLTYPCEQSKNVGRILTHESPNPMRGTGRDLSTDPVGQPVHIIYPAAKSIKVSNVIYKDSKTDRVIPVHLLDSDSDPYKNTDFELPLNSAFIIPLTDNFDNCGTLYQNNPNNCGLDPETNYTVSFEVLVDGAKRIKRAFEFTTADWER